MGGKGNGRAREWEGRGMGGQGNGRDEGDLGLRGDAGRTQRKSTISATRVAVSRIATVGRP